MRSPLLADGTRVRIWVHALDRTGPPMLVRSVVRWLSAELPGLAVEVLAFRGGPLAEELEALVPVRIVLDDHEPWEHGAPDPGRLAGLRGALADLRPALNLLVSTSAGQCLQVVGDVGPIVAWSVEVGEDLHWLEGPVPVRSRVDRWLAGSQTTADDLALRGIPAVAVVPEFVDEVEVAAAEALAARAELGVEPSQPLVVAAGIGTHRKGVDLFLEVALALGRIAPEVACRWIGGEHDRLRPEVEDVARALQLPSLRFESSTPRLPALLAAADAFVHPARLDAFPLVCLHAALVETPVVGFAGTGGLSEMFGPTAHLVPYPDVRAMAEAVAEVAGRRRSGPEGGDQAAWVRERFTTDQAMPRLLDSVADLVVPT